LTQSFSAEAWLESGKRDFGLGAKALAMRSIRSGPVEIAGTCQEQQPENA
jgi:hypothetical protein